MQKLINLIVSLLGGTTAQETEATEAALSVAYQTSIRQVLERGVELSAEEAAELNATKSGSQEEIDAAKRIMDSRIAKAKAEYAAVEEPALIAIEFRKHGWKMSSETPNS